MISYITAFFGGGKSEKEKKIVSGIGKKVGVLSYKSDNIHLVSMPCGFQCKRGCPCKWILYIVAIRQLDRHLDRGQFYCMYPKGGCFFQ